MVYVESVEERSVDGPVPSINRSVVDAWWEARSLRAVL